MTILLSAFDSSSSWRSEGITEDIIASGQTGQLLSVTAPQGKVVRFIYILSGTTTEQDGISLVNDGVTLESEQILAASNGSTSSGARFGVSFHFGSPNSRLYPQIEGESIQISKNAGNTTQSIRYAYETGSYE